MKVLCLASESLVSGSGGPFFSFSAENRSPKKLGEMLSKPIHVNLNGNLLAKNSDY